MSLTGVVMAANDVAAVTLVIADGTRDSAIVARAPYDLVIANILAGPLIAMAPEIAGIAAARATIVLAGLPLGVALGGLEVGAPAFALEDGHEALVAVPLAAFAAGSVLASAWVGHSPRAGGPAARTPTTSTAGRGCPAAGAGPRC